MRRDRDGGWRPSARTDRAVSETISFVLVFSLIVASVGAVYAIGVSELEATRDAERIENAQRAFDVLADNVDDVLEGAPSRGTEVKLAEATLRSADDASMNVTVDPEGGGTPPKLGVFPLAAGVQYRGGRGDPPQQRCGPPGQCRRRRRDDSRPARGRRRRPGSAHADQTGALRAGRRRWLTDSPDPDGRVAFPAVLRRRWRPRSGPRERHDAVSGSVGSPLRVGRLRLFGRRRGHPPEAPGRYPATPPTSTASRSSGAVCGPPSSSHLAPS